MQSAYDIGEGKGPSLCVCKREQVSYFMKTFESLGKQDKTLPKRKRKILPLLGANYAFVNKENHDS